MQTRKEFLELPYVDSATAAARHRAFYGQFVVPGLIAAVVARIGADRIRKSRRESFNDIPLHEWDALHPLVMSYCEKSVRAAYDGIYWISDSLCIAKECAQQYRESQTANKGE